MFLRVALALAGCGTPPQPAPVAAPPAATAAPTRAADYALPPQNVLDVLHAPAPAQPIPSPTYTASLLVSWVTYPPMSQVAEPFLKLAGVRLEPRTRRKHDTPGGYGVAPCAQTLAVTDIASGKEAPIALPPGGCADAFTWSADGTRFAFRNTSAEAVELWIGDLTGATHRLGDVRLNPMLGSSLQWAPDQQSLLVKLVPEAQGPPPLDAPTADGPEIQETDGKSGQFSTYEARDVLKDAADEARFTYYGTSRLAWVDAATGKVTPLGDPGVYSDVGTAPNGEYVLVERIRAPYSHAVTWERFAHDVEVWDRAGHVTSVAQLPVAERVPIHGVPVGPRSHQWRDTEPATLLWAEAQDGGDWNVEVPQRDIVFTLGAPFTGAPAELLRTTSRFGGIDWSEQPDAALLYEYDDNRHWQTVSLLDLAKPGGAPSVLWDMSSDERYADPGDPVHRVLPNGRWVIRQSEGSLWLSGTGATTDGDRPFLDRFDLAGRKAERLFRSEKGKGYEYFLGFTGDATFLSWHQSPTDPPNLFERTLGAPVAGTDGEPMVASTAREVTHLPDPTPIVRQITKRLVKYERRDGTPLSFTLYTPPGYQEGTPIPAILNAYPLDYASAATAGQVRGSDQTFTRLSNYRLLLLSGYALIDAAAFPIVGDPKRAYDTYVAQLVDDAQAAVDKAVSLGVVDRDRIAVTGHSHGALMTVNLLAHTDLFRAGAATSGSYNKTLTPFGFQSERRSVWDATEVYLKVSPFFLANQIKTPLLLVHGAEDANPGTTPVQAELLYEAIRGNGGTARLVMLPHEPHWYSAMESNEQLAYEELTWFDEYVKNAPPREARR
jgi:dipeptidyl aminopeptidase/acylaminoacyl peptidase